MLIIVVAIQSCFDGSVRTERIVVNLSLFALVLSGIRSLSQSRWRTLVALALGVCGLVLSMLTEVYDTLALVDSVYVCYLIILLLLLVSLAESVFSLDPLHRDRIVGAINIYFVMALAWAFAYSLFELHWPGSFALTQTDRAGINHNLINDMFYFSTVTLTTLGYGDVVPLSKPTRTLAAMEAMTGQLYVAVVIAHMVGMRISQSVREANKPVYPSDDK